MAPLVATVTAAGGRYDCAAPNVHTLRKITLTQVQKDALIDGYEGRTAEMKRSLSTMVDSLPQANADLCPYCCLDQNPDLDHFLPKARFPEFSLHARNLLPICTHCNRKKSSVVRTRNDRSRVILNPSFEPSIRQPILQASLNYAQGKPYVTYQIDDAGLLSAAERAVALCHFDRLGLPQRYRKRAHGYLGALKESLSGVTQSVGRQSFRNEIGGSLLGEPINGWKPALFRAINANPSPLEAWVLPP